MNDSGICEYLLYISVNVFITIVRPKAFDDKLINTKLFNQGSIKLILDVIKKVLDDAWDFCLSGYKVDPNVTCVIINEHNEIVRVLKGGLRKLAGEI